MAKLVTIIGGSGFVGRYIARRMAKQGWRVRVAVRRPNDAHFVRPYGVVGQVEPVFCNIRDDGSVRDVLRGADAVINCVGILAESGRQSFESIQHQGAARVARIAAEEGVSRFVQISAIGADPEAHSRYARTKGMGEEAVRRAFPGAVILRPSIIFGHEDEFFNRFAAMTRISPFLPVIGANTRFQPVYVDDVARAAEKAVVEGVKPGIYELGGPDVDTFRDLMRQMLHDVRRRRIIVAVPFWAARLIGWVFDGLSWLTGGLVSGPVTGDQVANLRRDNVVGEGVMTFADLGIVPIPTEAVLPDYLWRFRPSGQYAESNDSMENVRTGRGRLKGGSGRAPFS